VYFLKIYLKRYSHGKIRLQCEIELLRIYFSSPPSGFSSPSAEIQHLLTSGISTNPRRRCAQLSFIRGEKHMEQMFSIEKRRAIGAPPFLFQL